MLRVTVMRLITFIQFWVIGENNLRKLKEQRGFVGLGTTYHTSFILMKSLITGFTEYVKDISIFLLYSLLLTNTVSAQEYFSISGYISDKNSGERLAGSSIYSLSDRSGTSSNAYGYYTIKLKRGDQTIIVSSVGYQSDTLILDVITNSTIRFSLIPKSSELAEVTITGQENRNLMAGEINKAGLSPAEIKALPRFGGEVDVVKALQFMPGIRAGREGSSDLLVRGGGPDQNLILLDGVPIYNSAHSLGLFSVFNADAIKDVELSKGGFSSRYGGRLSSVLDIKLKDGNTDHFRYDVSVGLISSKFMIEGPLKNENTTFLLAARRTYLDILAAIAQGRAENRGNYNFYDLNAKLTHKISEKDRLYFSVYSGKDHFGVRSDSKDNLNETRNSLNWGSITSAMRYNHLFNNHLFGNLTLTYTNYRFGVNSSAKDRRNRSDYSLNYSSKIADAGIKMDFDYVPSNNHFIRFGSNLILHNFKPNVTSLKSLDNGLLLADTAFNSNNTKAKEYFLYAEDEIRLSNSIQANIGLHFSGFNVEQRNYTSLQPRISINWIVKDKNAIRASFATMSQYIHLLTTTGTGSPADIWIPSTKKIEPQNSWQTTLGFAKSLAGAYELNIDGFYKKLDRVIEYKQGASFLEDAPENGLIAESSESWEDKVVAGSGRAYGAELLLRKKEGKTTGWIGYTLSWSDRNFAGVNNSQPFPYTYDSRHNLSVVSNQNISKRIRLSGTWVYNSGVPATLPLSAYKYYREGLGGASIENLNVRNNYRMRSYHRLDLGISFIKQKKRGERSWNISVYNAYNRKNPFFVEVGVSTSNGKTQLYQYSLLPVIPSFSYSFSFK